MFATTASGGGTIPGDVDALNRSSKFTLQFILQVIVAVPFRHGQSSSDGCCQGTRLGLPLSRGVAFRRGFAPVPRVSTAANAVGAVQGTVLLAACPAGRADCWLVALQH